MSGALRAAGDVLRARGAVVQRSAVVRNLTSACSSSGSESPGENVSAPVRPELQAMSPLGEKARWIAAPLARSA